MTVFSNLVVQPFIGNTNFLPRWRFICMNIVTSFHAGSLWAELMNEDDYPLRAVPQSARKSFFSLALLLLGFTLFTATMWAGGAVGTAFDLTTLLAVIGIGNLLLGFYAAALAWMAARSGLSSVLMARFALGNRGSVLADLLLGITQIGWYAWGTATIADALVAFFEWPDMWRYPFIVFFGAAFCATAFIGYRGLDWLSRFAVPVMMIMIALSMTRAWQDAGGVQGLATRTPDGTMNWSMALTMIFGTFVSGATQASNWSRFARTPMQAIVATLLAFFIGNGLMVLVGALGARVYSQADIVEVLMLQGLAGIGILMLFLNLWTTQDNTIYNFAAAGCNLLRTSNRHAVTLGGAGIGTLLALLGMDAMLVPFLVLLGTCIPPLGGVLFANYLFHYKARFPALEQSTLEAFHLPGLGAYVLGVIAAMLSPWLAPLAGIGIAFIAYPLIRAVTKPSAVLKPT